MDRTASPAAWVRSFTNAKQSPAHREVSMLGHALKTALRYVLRQILVRAIAPPVRRKLNQFETATHDPRAVQEAILQGILLHQAGTAYGRDHHFTSITNVADF